MLIACMNELKDAIAFAQAAESHWPASMYMPESFAAVACLSQPTA